MAFLLGGCRANKPSVLQDDPVCGGVTDHTDVSAPKQIQSDDLRSLHTEFYCFDELDDSRSGRYAFDLKENDTGVLELCVDGVISGSVPVSSEVLDGAQSIIKEQKLVEWNGVDKITAGLPPEYGPCTLEAEYASGEIIRFCQNNDPYAAWVKALQSYFLQVLAACGLSEAEVPAEALTIDRFSMSFNVENVSYSYGTIICENNVVKLYEEQYDMDKKKTISEKIAELNEEIFEGLQKVIESCNLDSIGGTTISFALEHTSDGYAEVYVDYVNGRQIYAEYAAAELPEDWPQMRQALLDYFADVFS